MNPLPKIPLSTRGPHQKMRPKSEWRGMWQTTGPWRYLLGSRDAASPFELCVGADNRALTHSLTHSLATGEKVAGKLDEKRKSRFLLVIRQEDKRRRKRRTLEEEEKRRKEEGETWRILEI